MHIQLHFKPEDIILMTYLKGIFAVNENETTMLIYKNLILKMYKSHCARFSYDAIMYCFTLQYDTALSNSLLYLYLTCSAQRKKESNDQKICFCRN